LLREKLRKKETARRRKIERIKSPAARRPEKRRRFARLAIYIFSLAVIFAAAPAEAAIDSAAFSNSLRSARFHKAAGSGHYERGAAGAQAEIMPVSLSGLARRLPAGIYSAPGAVTTCFNARMVTLLAAIQRKYRRPLIITSGYRSQTHNISAGGVRGSLHTACAAADIKIPGVNKYQLAGYIRSLPGRGGVGLYCHDAVHVDIGSPREWNWCAAGGRGSRSQKHGSHKHKSRSHSIRRHY